MNAKAVCWTASLSYVSRYAREILLQESPARGRPDLWSWPPRRAVDVCGLRQTHGRKDVGARTVELLAPHGALPTDQASPFRGALRSKAATAGLPLTSQLVPPHILPGKISGSVCLLRRGILNEWPSGGRYRNNLLFSADID